jgi:hypothetical protein
MILEMNVDYPFYLEKRNDFLTIEVIDYPPFVNVTINVFL